MSATFTFDGDTTEGVNVSNANLFRILRSLDIAPDYCGQVEAADLKARVLTAMAVGGKDIVDTADPASKGIMAALADGGACVLDLTPPLADYLDRRLPYLLAVAEAAEAAGKPVWWA